MSTLFSSLSQAQSDQLKAAPSLITILVAGADGDIDHQELNWAEKLTKIRSYSDTSESLNGFYAEVDVSFTEDFDKAIKELPEDLAQRETIISNKLAELNPILANLDNATAYALYTSFVSFAEHIAKASGGFLRFGSISAEEKKWIAMPMLTPIILEEPPVEEEA
jgi:hypothetical protein